MANQRMIREREAALRAGQELTEQYFVGGELGTVKQKGAPLDPLPPKPKKVEPPKAEAKPKPKAKPPELEEPKLSGKETQANINALVKSWGDVAADPNETPLRRLIFGGLSTVMDKGRILAPGGVERAVTKKVDELALQGVEKLTGKSTTSPASGTLDGWGRPKEAPAPTQTFAPPEGVSRDEDLAVRVALAEFGGEPEDGQIAGLWVMNNRAKQSGKSLGQVVTAPGQFEGLSRAKSYDPKSVEYQQMLAKVRAVTTGGVADPTGGATHFLNPELQAKLGRAQPSWASGSGQRIGQHVFYRPGGGIRADGTMVLPELDEASVYAAMPDAPTPLLLDPSRTPQMERLGAPPTLENLDPATYLAKYDDATKGNLDERKKLALYAGALEGLAAIDPGNFNLGSAAFNIARGGMAENAAIREQETADLLKRLELEMDLEGSALETRNKNALTAYDVEGQNKEIAYRNAGGLFDVYSSNVGALNRGNELEFENEWRRLGTGLDVAKTNMSLEVGRRATQAVEEQVVRQLQTVGLFNPNQAGYETALTTASAIQNNSPAAQRSALAREIVEMGALPMLFDKDSLQKLSEGITDTKNPGPEVTAAVARLMEEGAVAGGDRAAAVRELVQDAAAAGLPSAQLIVRSWGQNG